ncbi:hypothetical protein AB6A40_000841 [Gnathostoma spinigerum]|uniref:Uncharacterized protein n=1 Tax=Gnathostoma spinigerum TaxID=75299 RepID=A0ABD6EBS1_9BILA
MRTHSGAHLCDELPIRMKSSTNVEMSPENEGTSTAQIITISIHIISAVINAANRAVYLRKMHSLLFVLLLLALIASSDSAILDVENGDLILKNEHERILSRRVRDVNDEIELPTRVKRDMKQYKVNYLKPRKAKFASVL